MRSVQVFANFLFVLAAVAAPAEKQSGPWTQGAKPISSLVDLGYARYQGVTIAAGVNQYLGLRYAAPPLGSLRFAAPADPLPQNTTQDASQHGPICYEVGSGLAGGESEDCLFIDVYAPSNATEQSKLPVFFWIQGGGYVQNSNNDYNGTSLITSSGGNIVVVNFNYRVGPFGFLASEAVRKDGHLNAGLLDQRKALHWAQKHISRFGGDPEHVVVVGASAGAGSIALHLTAYGGRNDSLFVGAIGESVFFPTQPQVSELEFQFSTFANASGCSSGDQLECLRSQDSATLQNANTVFPYPGQSNSPLFPYSPCIDGDFIQDYPYKEFKVGNFVKVPVIFGNCNDEGSVFAVNANGPSDISSFFQDNYPKLTSNQTAAINAQYPLSANPPAPEHNQYFEAASNAYGEATFTCPALLITSSYAQYSQSTSTWSYRFALLSPYNVAAGLGTPHTYEIGAVWGQGGYAADDEGDMPLMMDYWISFVRALDPNVYKEANSPEWESVGSTAASGNQSRLLFGDGGNTTMECVPSDQQERCAFWKGLAVTMEQ